MIDRRVGVAAAVGAAAVALLLVVAVAAALGGDDEVRRNVRIAGQDVGGLDRAGLDAVMADIETGLAAIDVEIVTPSQPLTTTLGGLGVGVDRAATADAALEAGRGGFILLRPFRWLGSFFGHVDSDVALMLDEGTFDAAVAVLEQPVRVEPVEPSLAYRNGELTTVPGEAGRRLDADDLASQLIALDGDELDGSTVVLEGSMVPLPPRQSDESVTQLLDDVEDRLDRRFDVAFDPGDETGELDGTELAPFVRAQQTDDGRLVIDLDPEPTLAYLAATFSGVGTEPKEPEISVSGGGVVIGYATPGTTCCTAEAVRILSDALEGSGTSVTLPLAEKKPEKDTAYYASLGIKELVSTFTTEHPCCAPRVRNIHRMADIVGARVIAPGETFSLNDTVGRRTIANGFAAAPTINGDGNFEDDVGGGVSQFSTTLFNAAFFAGLEIDEYMAHGLYISRYPYGREATLSYPSPDLKIRNQTPYGVLLWPSYTDTSITISLYSTKHIEAWQSGQSESVYGAVCTEVTTYRTRKWIETGKSEVDRFYALYGPAEGVQCDGTTRPKPGETTTTTTSTTAPPAPPPPTTAPPPNPDPAGSTTTVTAGSG